METTASGNALLTTQGITRSYRGRQVVKGVDLHVGRGEIVGLLGPNGAGKTTTFYMVVGLVKPTAGVVTFHGEDITRVPMYQRARRGVGYLAQEPSVFRKLSVADNILAILETLPLSRAAQLERLDVLLEDLGLTKLAGQRAYTLSGGERRRLEIARALVPNPELILLDEPFSGVDPIAVADVQDIVRGLKERGLGILITDHSVRETLSIVDRAYLMFEGQVQVEGTSEFLINDETSRKRYLGDDFSM